MKRLIIIKLIFFALLANTFGKSNSEVRNFSVTCSIYVCQSADQIIFKVNSDSIWGTDYCGTDNCKDSLQYSKALTSKQSERYYSLIKSLQLDTLRNSYSQYATDGAAITITVNGDSLPSKSIYIFNYHPQPVAIEKLLQETMRFFPKKRKWKNKLH